MTTTTSIPEQHQKLHDSITAIYTNYEMVGDMALVIYFILDCPTIGGIQPVFLAQKELSLRVRIENDIPNPYLN